MSRSLEAALDEERQEVMNILEGRPTGHRSSSAAPLSPRVQDGGPSSPAPVVRSMLDIGPAAPRHGSIAGLNVGVTVPPLRSAPLMKSMLDPQTPTTPRITHSPALSATDPTFPNHGIHRAGSDASLRPLEGRPRADSERDKGSVSNLDYQFDMTSTVSSSALPKRVTQGRRKSLARNAMASIMQGQELDPVPRTRDRGRHNSTAGIIGGKSKSPSSRLSNRSQSPGGSMLNTNSFNLMPSPGKFVTDAGKVIDMNNAYRRLSDANLLKSGSNLSSLPAKTASQRARLDSGEALSPTGEARMTKDYYDDDDDGEGAIESSDEDQSSDEDGWGPLGLRGRRKSRKKKGVGGGEADNEDSENEVPFDRGPDGLERRKGPRMAHSLLAAAEEERLSVSSQYKVKSLLEPTVTVTGPGGEKMLVRKAGVHPNTNYNSQPSGMPSPATSDSEDLSDIRRAQRLTINMSPVDSSIPNRVIRTIIRGEFSRMQQEAEEGSRRLRTYLVATDLSGEAAYALEWTIGTVLRDGDTLLAVYAVDEEVGTGKTGETDSVHGLPIGEGGQAMQETAAIVGRLTAATQNNQSMPIPSPLGGPSLFPGSGKDSRAGSTDSRAFSKATQERFHAIEDISQTCIKFLRKTKLQVRIAVEVIHCKSPKYMITEAIDMLEPTLVILGSRGRSALKGVLLGSFSNYLVTKSSVPVMVARKKLQKPNAKNRLPHVRLANNLTPSKKLSDAIID